MFHRPDPEAEAVAQALADLRQRITVSLRAFNDATPHGSWLKRSEIARITRDVLRIAERASRRRAPPVRALDGMDSWLGGVGGKTGKPPPAQGTL